tara:strand:+ start:75 stop:356 length:282 start_codon:yes stop_codon:yes gene_type:complete
MIDTDKYEGHTEGEWKWYEGARHKSLTGSMRLLMFAEDGNNEHPKPADAALIADAPLFLAEVKRLRKAIIEVTFDEHESVYEMKQALVKVIER